MARVKMLLAQGPGKPDGDLEEGLDLTACLNRQGQIDVAAYEADPLPWRARRFWRDRERLVWAADPAGRGRLGPAQRARR